MSWFNKNTKEEENQEFNLPELPKLPELPDFPGNKQHSKEKLPKLPSFPTSSLGQRFSQDAIKNAVTGKKESDGGFAGEMDDSLEMHFPPQNIGRREIGEEIPREMPKEIPKKKMGIDKEPIFIRIDKFEDGLNTFKKAKLKISEIEEMLKNIRHLKNQEEKELAEWEAEIQGIKTQIQRVDNDVFSKIE